MIKIGGDVATLLRNDQGEEGELIFIPHGTSVGSSLLENSLPDRYDVFPALWTHRESMEENASRRVHRSPQCCKGTLKPVVIDQLIDASFNDPDDNERKMCKFLDVEPDARSKARRIGIALE